MLYLKHCDLLLFNKQTYLKNPHDFLITWGMFATLEKGTVAVTWENDNPITVGTHGHSSNFAAGPLAECTSATTSFGLASQLAWLGHRDDSPRGDEGRCKGDSSRVSTLEMQCSGRAVRVWADSALLGFPHPRVRKPYHEPL